MTPTPDRTEIEDLKASVDLAAVMESNGIRLKTSGKSRVGLCPFHDDDEPSLSLTGSLFQCFSCQASGDVLSFLPLPLLMLHSSGAIGRVGILRKDKASGIKMNGRQIYESLAGSLKEGGYHLSETSLKPQDSAQECLLTASNADNRIEIKALATDRYVYQLLIVEPVEQSRGAFENERYGCFESFRVSR